MQMCRAAGWARGAAGGTRRGAAGWVRGAAGWQAHLEGGLAHVVCQVLLVHDHLLDLGHLRRDLRLRCALHLGGRGGDCLGDGGDLLGSPRRAHPGRLDDAVDLVGGDRRLEIAARRLRLRRGDLLGRGDGLGDGRRHVHAALRHRLRHRLAHCLRHRARLHLRLRPGARPGA